jgi:hypothetical protein
VYSPYSMAQFPSIQSFFKPELPSKDDPQKLVMSSSAGPSDGFTAEEIEAALHPSLPKFQPRCEYQETNIESLVPGPGCISIVGRVVNLNHQQRSSQMPNAAEGCWRLIVKDDTGTLLVILSVHCILWQANTIWQVKLYYAKVSYQIHLGHLVSIWTPHTSHADTISLTLQNAYLATSIFPERDNTCYFMSQKNSDGGTLCRKPQGYTPGKELSHLISLKNFIGGGHEVSNGKIMICVKSIGGKRKSKFLHAKD